MKDVIEKLLIQKKNSQNISTDGILFILNCSDVMLTQRLQLNPIQPIT